MRKFYSRIILLSALAVALFAQGSRAQTLVHKETSLYHNIFVYDHKGMRCLLFKAEGQGPQSCVMLRFPDEMLLDYTKMMLGALYVRPDPRRILIIGLGGGTLQTTLAKFLPEAEIDTAEIDPAIARIAEKHFNFQTGPRQRVIFEDGRVFVKRAVQNGKRYDMIMLDAFKGQVIPEHLLTQEFIKEAKSLLAENGVFIANTNATAGLYSHESVTYESVYGKFLNLKAGSNRVIIARQDGTLPAIGVMQKNAELLDSKLNRYGIDFAWLTPLLVTQRDWDSGARILTDQYAPSNLLNGVPYYQQ